MEDPLGDWSMVGARGDQPKGTVFEKDAGIAPLGLTASRPRAAEKVGRVKV